MEGLPARARALALSLSLSLSLSHNLDTPQTAYSHLETAYSRTSNRAFAPQNRVFAQTRDVPGPGQYKQRDTVDPCRTVNANARLAREDRPRATKGGVFSRSHRF